MSTNSTSPTNFGSYSEEESDTSIAEENVIEEDDAETKHFKRIVNAFRYYRTHSIVRVLRAEKHYDELPSHHKELISHFKHRLDEIRVCVEHNYEIIKLILLHTHQMFENKESAQVNDDECTPASEFDMDKVKSTLKQFVRDWSSDGQSEREACYVPVIQEVQKLFSPDQVKKENVRILVPGAGLGRLAWEIARLGYTCQGNECSLFMLFASNFILNKCYEPDMLTLYPWVHQFCNLRQHEDQVHAVTFPDVNPADLAEFERDNEDMPSFSMAAGDFLEVYRDPNTWDCICTVFFIDTASNVMAYIETIWNVLKPGGYWINLGPLLYHFADMSSESSIELTYEELRSVIKKFNFEIVKEEPHVPATYTENVRSMLKYKYDCVYFVARKPHTHISTVQQMEQYQYEHGECVTNTVPNGVDL